MPIFQFGFMIKHRREELGYTQEDLADGICSVPTLSRIENGERMPTREHFEMLSRGLVIQTRCWMSMWMRSSFVFTN